MITTIKKLRRVTANTATAIGNIIINVTIVILRLEP